MACADAATSGQDNFQAMRERMVETQISARDVENAAVLQAMRRVPRHLFVPDDLRPYAYEDRPLPIGRGQTISQPYIVAYMTEALQLAPAHTVLEIGTGSGYQSAILADIVKQVYSIEIVPDLAESARRALAQAGVSECGGAHRQWLSRVARARAFRSHHCHRGAAGDSTGARRSTCGRRRHGCAGGNVASGDRGRHEDAGRRHPEAHHRSEVRADGIEPGD